MKASGTNGEKRVKIRNRPRWLSGVVESIVGAGEVEHEVVHLPDGHGPDAPLQPLPMQRVPPVHRRRNPHVPDPCEPLPHNRLELIQRLRGEAVSTITYRATVPAQRKEASSRGDWGVSDSPDSAGRVSGIQEEGTTELGSLSWLKRRLQDERIPAKAENKKGSRQYKRTARESRDGIEKERATDLAT